VSRLPLLGVLLLISGRAFADPAYHPTHGSEILWDRYGVPHVYARSLTDLFYSFGWAQIRSHGDIIARLYAEARGRAAEYFGPEELENDRWMVTNDVPARAQVWLKAQEPSFRQNLEAFAAGMNAYARAHPEALSADARRVFPMSAADVLAHQQRMFQFVYAAPADIVKRIPPDAEPPPREPPGSNGWAIAPARSASGHAMLLMNPHLYWAPGWARYYEAQLSAPGIDLYGATQVGLPVLRFLFSDYVSFTHTVNAPHGVTFYAIRPEGNGYRYDGRVLPFQTRAQTLKVRQADGSVTTETVTVRGTLQGPIVGERNGRPIAMRVAGLDRPGALAQYWLMDTAHGLADFQAALRRMQIPTFNNVYADRDGHIQYLYMALVPRHTWGALSFWSGTVPGDTSKTLWTDYLDFDELPKVLDPAGGTVQNSNDPPWNAAWPQTLDPAPYTSEIESSAVSLRMARGIRMLSSTRRISFEELVADKWSTRSELADRILPDLLEAAQRDGDELARQGAEVLAHWDRCLDPDSRGAVLFMAWSDHTGAVNGYSGKGFARPYELHAPLTTPAGLADPKAAVEALSAAVRDTIASYGAPDVPWGQVMRFQLGSEDVPARGGPGRLGVFNAIDFAARQGGTRAANFGGSFTAVVSFDATPRAKVLSSYGSSSQPGTTHASDQLALLSAGTLRDAWRTRADVAANLESTDRF
jgi:acyl-homoserine-lactone acylase